MEERHCLGVIDILNYYIENTGYTFIESKVPYRLFEPLIFSLGGVLSLVAVDNGKVMGMVMFKKYSKMSYFDGVVEMGIYVREGQTCRGIGAAMLNEAQRQLRNMGVRMICTTVSSLNEPSIAFHKGMGFTECGAYDNIGRYKDMPFAIIHFQKEL